jgi:hypothetical protein
MQAVGRIVEKFATPATHPIEQFPGMPFKNANTNIKLHLSIHNLKIKYYNDCAR